MRLVAFLQARLSSVLRELLKFGIVGAVAFVVDVGLFNLLRYAVFTETDKPLTAKTISVVVATAVAYFGNRHWTFRHRGSHGMGRETVLFFVVNAIALGMALVCLGASHYVLGFQGPLADNLSANVIGLGLGTAFRFWAYSRWVFPHVDASVPLTPVRTPAAAAASVPVSPLEPAAAFRTRLDREAAVSAATSSAA